MKRLSLAIVAIAAVTPRLAGFTNTAPKFDLNARPSFLSDSTILGFRKLRHTKN